jgi:hypothetical protein
MILTVAILAVVLVVGTKLLMARRKYRKLLTAKTAKGRFYQLCHLVRLDRDAERAQRKVSAFRDGNESIRRARATNWRRYPR